MRRQQPEEKTAISSNTTQLLEEFANEGHSNLVNKCQELLIMAPENSANSQIHFRNIKDILLFAYDRLDGIVTHSINQTEFAALGLTENLPSGHAYLRDATAVKKHAPKIPKKQQQHYKDALNTLQRCLARMRFWWNFVDRLTDQDNNSEICTIFKENLQQEFSDLLNNIFAANSDPKKFDEAFNTTLAQLVQQHLLSKSVKHDHLKKILLRSRNLAAVLDPANSVVTKTQATVADEVVEVLDISHPLTYKTPTQLTELDNLAASKASDLLTQMTRSVMPELKSHDRMLPAQARKEIKETVKNAYLSQRVFKKADGTIVAKHALVHSATPGYVGKHADEKQRAEAATRNYSQVQYNLAHITDAKQEDPHQRTITPVAIHSNTNATFNKEEDAYNAAEAMMHTVAEAHIDLKTSQMYYISQNGMSNGVTKNKEIVPNNLDTIIKSRFSQLSGRSKAANTAARIVLYINKNKDIPWLFCMSGQDRTNTAREAWCTLVTLKSLGDIARSKKIRQLYLATLQQPSVAGKHSTFLTSVIAPGSPGLKKESCPKDSKLLIDELKDAIYLDSADTNKSASFKNPKVKIGVQKANIVFSLPAEALPTDQTVKPLAFAAFDLNNIHQAKLDSYSERLAVLATDLISRYRQRTAGQIANEKTSLDKILTARTSPLINLRKNRHVTNSLSAHVQSVEKIDNNNPMAFLKEELGMFADALNLSRTGKGKLAKYYTEKFGLNNAELLKNISASNHNELLKIFVAQALSQVNELSSPKPASSTDNILSNSSSSDEEKFEQKSTSSGDSRSGRNRNGLFFTNSSDASKIASIRSKFNNPTEANRVIELIKDNLKKRTTRLNTAVTALRKHLKDSIIDFGKNPTVNELLNRFVSETGKLNQTAGDYKWKVLTHLVAMTREIIKHTTRSSSVIKEIIVPILKIPEASPKDKTHTEHYKEKVNTFLNGICNGLTPVNHSVYDISKSSDNDTPTIDLS